MLVEDMSGIGVHHTAQEERVIWKKEEKQRERACWPAPKSSRYSPVPFASTRVRISAQWKGCKNVAGEGLFQSSKTYQTGYHVL